MLMFYCCCKVTANEATVFAVWQHAVDAALMFQDNMLTPRTGKACVQERLSIELVSTLSFLVGVFGNSPHMPSISVMRYLVADIL